MIFLNFKESEFLVVREYEEFVWFYDWYVENEEYVGVIVSINKVNIIIY